MQDPKKLRVFWESHKLVLLLDSVIKRFPDHERYALGAQLRRASQSIPMNIAEGCKRASAADNARHINIAEGSLGEVEYQIFLACELGYIPKDLYQDLARGAADVGRMLHGYRKAVLAGRDLTAAPAH